MMYNGTTGLDRKKGVISLISSLLWNVKIQQTATNSNSRGCAHYRYSLYVGLLNEEEILRLENNKIQWPREFDTSEHERTRLTMMMDSVGKQILNLIYLTNPNRYKCTMIYDYVQ